MNNLSEFEKIIKGKVDSFEYPYDDASWKKFKKSVSGKSSYWGYAALFGIVAITAICLMVYFNSQNTASLCLKNKLTDKQDNSVAVNNLNDAKEINADSYNSESKTNIINSVSSVNKNTEVITTDNISNGSISNDNQVTINYNNPVINNIQTNQHTNKPNATFICDKKEGCLPLTVKFIPTEISDTLIYSWDFGDGNISTEKIPQHIYKEDGNFSVTLIVKYYKSESVVTNKLQNLIKVFEQPVAQFNWTNNDNVFGFENLSLGATKFKWIFSDSTSNEENVSKVFRVSGKYPVQLIAINKYGCSDIFTKEVNVQITMPYQMAANSFTPDGDGGNDYFGPQVVENDNDNFHCDFKIFNKNGKLIFEAKGTPNDVQWNGFDKSSNKLADEGIYFYDLKIEDKFGNTDRKNGKVILQR